MFEWEYICTVCMYMYACMYNLLQQLFGIRLTFPARTATQPAWFRKNSPVATAL